VHAHLAGPDAAAPLLDHLVFSTSGSTGETRALRQLPRRVRPLGGAPDAHRSPCSGWARTCGSSAWARPRRGTSPGTSWRACSPGAVAAPRTSAETPLPEIVAPCNAFQPQAIVGYPSVHALLAQEQLAERLRIAPSVVAYAGEVLTPDMRDRIREAWGVEPASMYSTTEAADDRFRLPGGRRHAPLGGRRRWSRWSTNTTGRAARRAGPPPPADEPRQPRASR
jgi:hypothetical protein